VLANFISSNSSFLLATDFPLFKPNIEIPGIQNGRSRLVNLLIPPYQLPNPVCTTEDLCGSFGVYINLWDFRALRKAGKDKILLSSLS